MVDQKHSTPPTDDEIDLLALAKTLWQSRLTVIKSILIFGVIGFVVAITSPKEFVAKTVMVPSLSEGTAKLGGLGGLAAMAGINLNSNSGSDLSPSVYPQIVASLPFQLELMKTPINFSDNKEPVTFYDHYSVPKKINPFIKYTIGLPGVILSLPGTVLTAIRGKEAEKTGLTDQNQPIQITSKQRDVRLILSKLIMLDANQKEGILTLSATMNEPKAAAQLGQRAQELLQQYITEFKIKKAKANLDFIQQRYDETTKKFEAAQEKLAIFRDRNKNVSLAIAKTEEERLNSQYNLIYSIYIELAKQLEQAKIQVKQDTPVFTIIEPISVPTTKSKPNRPMIQMIWIFLGAVAGIGFVFSKNYLVSVKKQWYAQ